jgi:sugar phosphate isomerase/epimerase
MPAILHAGGTNTVLTRREFVGAALGVAGGVAVAGPALVKTSAPLGIQLFSLYALASSGWEGFSAALKAAQEIGYRAVELPGLMGQDVERVKALTGDLGLQMRSMHMGNDQVRERRQPGQSIGDVQNEIYTPEGIIDVARINLPLAKRLGCEWGVVAAAGRSNFVNRAAILKLCAAFNEANRMAQAMGLQLSYHMHPADFLPVSGVVPFDLLLGNTDVSICYQLDVCWAAAAGMDPATLIKTHHTRLVSLHLKDLAPDRMHSATAGDGVLDFESIRQTVKLLRNPLLYVECESRPGDDPALQARRAYQFLSMHGW